jgi:hypothetical protein
MRGLHCHENVIIVTSVIVKTFQNEAVTIRTTCYNIKIQTMCWILALATVRTNDADFCGVVTCNPEIARSLAGIYRLQLLDQLCVFSLLPDSTSISSETSGSLLIKGCYIR